MKQQLLTDLTGRLHKLGLEPVQGAGTDILLNKTFLDAAWGTGRKEIRYEACIFADESSQAVYMYELTTESGSGLSFGASGSSSFQSGATLYRKVKMVQYGPDGKAFEIDLNLGAIPGAVKDAAKQSGWKFKTVISRAKAMYPNGYLPASNLAAPPASAAPPIPKPPAAGGFCTGCGAPLPAGARFCGQCGKRTLAQ